MASKTEKIPFDLPTLPPDIDLSDLIGDISKASISLARLDETLKLIPNPGLLVERTFLTREAVLSSKIEGTQVTLEEVLKKEAEGEDPDDERADSRLRDYHEVINYRRALRTGAKMVAEGESLAENNVKELHRILLRSVRGETKAPGEFRRKQVWIGPPGTPMSDARYVPPTPTSVPTLYGNFDRYLNESTSNPLVQIAVAHYQFEAIHPFEDGNGRIGRLLIPLFLYKFGVLSHPLVFISKYFEEHRSDYYDLLAKVSYEDAWLPWIQFFLNGLCEQADEASELARRIITLREKYRSELVSMNSSYAFGLLDALFSWPIFTAASIAEPSGIPRVATRLGLIEKFEAAGLVRNLTPHRKRGKTYGFTPLLDVLDGKE